MARGVLLPPSDVLVARPPLARSLTERRVAAGIAQQVLADRVGVHVLTISSFEVGRTVPSARTLAKIKAVLGWRD
jgi:transcriptional regulator with XRE-family HTH domain